jgi:hypothetical protein
MFYSKAANVSCALFSAQNTRACLKPKNTFSGWLTVSVAFHQHHRHSLHHGPPPPPPTFPLPFFKHHRFPESWLLRHDPAHATWLSDLKVPPDLSTSAGTHQFMKVLQQVLTPSCLYSACNHRSPCDHMHTRRHVHKFTRSSGQRRKNLLLPPR